MKPKDFLKTAMYYDLAIKTKREELERLRSLALNITGSLREDKATVPLRKDRLEETVIKIIFIEDQINKEIDKFMDALKEIREKIQQLDNEYERLMLEMRYLCRKSWDEIADEADISLSYAYSLHGRALKSLDIILNEEPVVVNE